MDETSGAFETIEDARAAFPSPASFRIALVDDVHSGEGRFDDLEPMELLQACGVDVGNIDQFCLSQVCTDRRARLAGRDMDWRYRYTYRIVGKNRRCIRFQTEHGDGGVCEHIEGPYVYTRPFKKPRSQTDTLIDRRQASARRDHQPSQPCVLSMGQKSDRGGSS